MDNPLRTAIEQIHATSLKAALVVTGAGSQAAAWLLGVAGASRTVLEVTIPYASRSLIDYLGWQPRQYASAETALSLSAAAYARALHLQTGSEPVVGLGCTAAIATDRLKRGEHRCHITLWDRHSVTSHSLVLTKGVRSREEEETLASYLVIMALARAAGIPVKPPELKADEQIVTAVQAAGIPLDHLLSGYVDSLTVYGPGIVVPDEKPCAAILSGSFAPLHEGHLQLGRVASYLLDRPVMFEIATHNVDKSPLTAGVLTRRLAQFERLPNRVILSREPLYCDKAMLYPGSVFVLGYDTAARAVDPAYYHDDPTNMAEALSAVRSAGCRFLVAGRLMGDRFHTLDDLVIPPGYEDLFNGIPADLFRADISSTELRQRGPTC